MSSPGENFMGIKALKFFFILISCLTLVRALPAQENPPAFVPLKTDEPPVIDGVLDDPVWKRAPSGTGFKTWRPDYQQDMAEKTVVYFAYDLENLYFAYRCFDSEPGKIKASITRRDAIRPDDWVAINLDSYNDQQSLYAFYVNPLGIQMDARAAATQEDYGFDVVWYSEGRIDEEGYCVEIRIPLKSIRYSQKDTVEMGVIFERNISRHSQTGSYPPLDPQKGGNWFIQTRPLIYPGIEQPLLFELLPGFTYSHRSFDEEGRLKSKGHEGDLSLTAKYGITSHLIADGTYNPDFSQVEADAGQVDFNQRFALFYPEKRPFYLEGREIFNFGGAYGGDYLREVVHTRSIVNPLAGAKLSGKIGDNNVIAALYSLDELPTDESKNEYAHFSIFRYKRVLKEDSHIGGYFTSRQDDFGSNRVGGADGALRLSQAGKMGYHAFFSQDRFTDDSADKRGHALCLDYFHNTRNLVLMLGLQDLGKDFNTTTGFVTRTGVTRFRSGIVLPFYKTDSFLLRIDPMVHSTQIRDKFARRFETNNRADVVFNFPRNSSITVGYAYATEIFLDEKFKTSGFRVVGRSQIAKQFRFNASYRNSYKIRYVENPYQGRGSNLSAGLTYQPTEKIQADLNLTYSDFFRDSAREYNYAIIRSRNTYQVNKYLFFRAIFEHNNFRERFTTDFLASFTYIPGTVVHFGYGSLYERIDWLEGAYRPIPNLRETGRSFFFKASYLWRL